MPSRKISLKALFKLFYSNHIDIATHNESVVGNQVILITVLNNKSESLYYDLETDSVLTSTSSRIARLIDEHIDKCRQGKTTALLY